MFAKVSGFRKPGASVRMQIHASTKTETLSSRLEKNSAYEFKDLCGIVILTQAGKRM